MKENKIDELISEPDIRIVTAPVIYKNFTKKNAEKTDIMEMYIQGSSQDYFIKFCESKISRKELEEYLSTIVGVIKTATMELEFKEGNWDICDENELMQSRIGRYVTIHRIVMD